MNKGQEVIVIEKPDYVSWNDIQKCVWEAHEVNRSKGIIMGNSKLLGEEIKRCIGEKGKMFVALVEGKVVGTGAVIKKKVSLWCGKKDDEYAYMCFATVLPQYCGLGIYKKIALLCESLALSWGVDKILGDTHELNDNMLVMVRKNGSKFVDYKVCKDHFNVVFVKWLGSCPYSRLRCFLMFLIFKYGRKIKYKWLKKI